MSATNLLDLWSDDIHTDVLSPVMVLNAQIPALDKKASGILRAEVRSETNQQKVEHSLDLIAPALNDYRITLLKVWHDPELVYPAMVKSRGLLPSQTKVARLPESLLGMIGPTKQTTLPDERAAETQEEFVKIVGDALRSGWVRSLIQSLIARSNDVLADKAKARPNGAPSSSESPSE